MGRQHAIICAAIVAAVCAYQAHAVPTGYGTDRPPSATTEGRDALTPAAADTVYNTTTGRVETYDGAFWSGQYWLDMDFPLTRDRQGVSQKPDYDFTQMGLLFPEGVPTEIAYLTRQINHDWVFESIVHPHIHYYQTSADVAVWKFDLRVTENGAVPGGFTTYTSNSLVFSYTSGTIQQIAAWSPITLTGIDTLSAMVDIRLYRDDEIVSGDVLAKSFDLHIQVDRGSRGEYEK